MDRAGVPNAQMSNTQVRKICSLSPTLESFLESVAERMCLSPRACQRVLKVSRTLADMDGSALIQEQHLAESISYRELGGMAYQ